MTRVRVPRFAVAVLALALVLAGHPAPASAAGQMTYAVHISLAPTWFDPAETSRRTPATGARSRASSGS